MKSNKRDEVDLKLIYGDDCLFPPQNYIKAKNLKIDGFSEEEALQLLSHRD